MHTGRILTGIANLGGLAVLVYLWLDTGLKFLGFVVVGAGHVASLLLIANAGLSRSEPGAVSRLGSSWLERRRLEEEARIHELRAKLGE